jgi:very-short-patch-repair endonuclease
MPLQYNGKNTVLAKNLRKNATKQENHLWYDFLKDYEIKFQRQRTIDEFIADFYCQKANLIIEVDGNQHYSIEGINKDNYRTERLELYYLTVIRFTNNQIDNEFYEVCEYIDRTVKSIISSKAN